VRTDGFPGEVKLSSTDLTDDVWVCTTTKKLELEAKVAYYLARWFKLLQPRP
jgi:hypothetical protein